MKKKIPSSSLAKSYQLAKDSYQLAKGNYQLAKGSYQLAKGNCILVIICAPTMLITILAVMM